MGFVRRGYAWVKGALTRGPTSPAPETVTTRIEDYGGGNAFGYTSARENTGEFGMALEFFMEEGVAAMFKDELKKALETGTDEWLPLAQSTITQKGSEVELMHSEQLLNSIEVRRSPSGAFMEVGWFEDSEREPRTDRNGTIIDNPSDMPSNAEIANYMEFGTRTVPPRPFFAPAYEALMAKLNAVNPLSAPSLATAEVADEDPIKLGIYQRAKKTVGRFFGKRS